MEYSVLMSVYQKEEAANLKCSVESMMNQTEKPEQIVIVRDGPLTPELDRVLGQLTVGQEKLFTIVELKENAGLCEALNIGMRSCRNSLIARMDSDDISLPERCEKQLREFELNPELSIVGTNVDEFDTDPEIIVSARKVPEKHEQIVRYIHRRSPFNHNTVMYKKEEVIRCGGYQVRWKEDLDLFFRMLNNGCKAKNIQESLVLMRINQDGLRRRQSWSYCGSFIKVAYRNYKKKYINLLDLVFITTTQMMIYLMPKNIYRWILLNILREKSCGRIKSQ